MFVTAIKDYLHRPDICSCHLQHTQVNCIWDSIQHCSWQHDTEFDALSAQFEHLPGFSQEQLCQYLLNFLIGTIVKSPRVT